MSVSARPTRSIFRAMSSLLTTSQAAAILHVSPAYLRELTAQGKVRASHRTPGGHRRYSVDDVDRAKNDWGQWDVKRKASPARLPMLSKGIPDLLDSAYGHLGQDALSALVRSLAPAQMYELHDRIAAQLPDLECKDQTLAEHVTALALAFDAERLDQLCLDMYIRLTLPADLGEPYPLALHRTLPESMNSHEAYAVRSLYDLSCGLRMPGHGPMYPPILSALRRVQTGLPPEESHIGEIEWTQEAQVANCLFPFASLLKYIEDPEARRLGQAVLEWWQATCRAGYARRVRGILETPRPVS